MFKLIFISCSIFLVGIQCLENVYGINCSDPLVKKEYAMPASLEEIFETGLKIKVRSLNRLIDLSFN